MHLRSVLRAARVEIESRVGELNVERGLSVITGRRFEEDFAALAHFKHPGDHVILDVGANRGQSIAAIRYFEATTPVIAYEPNPLMVARLEKRFPQDPHLKITPCGLGSETGRFDFYVPYYKGVAFDGLASFDKSEAADWLNPERMFLFDRRHVKVKKLSCQVATLDSFQVKPSLIKIDVQGLEASVIKGGSDTIAEFRPVILMENNQPQRDAAQLLDMGYIPHAFETGRLRPSQTGKLNTFYIHPATQSLFDRALYA
jgi:FkbM family methyltransferase